MSHDDIRLECLKLAQVCPSGLSRSTEDIVEHARLYADFVLARHDGTVLRAANELAKTVNRQNT